MEKMRPQKSNKSSEDRQQRTNAGLPLQAPSSNPKLRMFGDAKCVSTGGEQPMFDSALFQGDGFNSPLFGGDDD